MLASVHVSEDGGSFVASLTVNENIYEGFGDSFSEALRNLADNYEDETD